MNDIKSNIWWGNHQASFVRVNDFSPYKLNPERVESINAYMDLNFNERFIAEMGTEQILDCLKSVVDAGRWLDLGAGTSTLFWAIPLNGITEISCCDIYIEPLFILHKFVSSNLIPPCYHDVLHLYGKQVKDLDNVRRLPWNHLIFDALQDWPAEISEEKFNLITAFGNFGISPTKHQYMRCFEHAAHHLAQSGIAIGADWIRRPEHIPQSDRDYKYLSEDLVELSIKMSGKELLKLKSIETKGDPIYSRVIIWAMR